MDSSKLRIEVVAAAIVQQSSRGEQVLIARRSMNMSGAGEWEFPGGKVESGETLEQALEREILEELGLQILVGDKIGSNALTNGTKEIHLSLFWASILGGKIESSEHDAYEWVQVTELPVERLSLADRPFVALISQGRR